MKEILTVSQLNDNIKYVLEETFGFVWVEGEVSNLHRPQSGHVYFTLKDNKSQIRAVYFRKYGFSKNQAANFELEEGSSVLCRARLSVYPPRGDYQLIIESVEPRGVGALQKAFEQLKAKLAAEGLFDDQYKKEIPFIPKRIGVITSPTGSVIRDILNITKRRYPAVDILIAPVKVQGSDAAADMIQALSNLHTNGTVDVIIIARGGGSLEDLAPFNDENLARKIFHSTIPIVSAIGHETDFTICDFVADLRAPTPSAAAELVVPERLELLTKITNLKKRVIAGYGRDMADRRKYLLGLEERFKDPRRQVTDLQIHLDELQQRMHRDMRHQRQTLAGKLQKLELRLKHASPEKRIQETRMLLHNLQKDSITNFRNFWTVRHESLQKSAAVLNSLSPLAVLQRGYSITRKQLSGELVRSAGTLSINEEVNIQLAKGKIQARVEKIYGE
ncbi:MAG: exodeoxyribonuclease VII large subunit [Deltaproteobacteria bacterium]